MYKQLLIPALAALFFSTSALADEIYRWVDGSGQVHYSDVPRDGAEQVELDPTQTFSAPKRSRSSSAAAQPQSTDQPAGYTALEIVSPSQEETIWNTGGVISIAVSPTPALQPGHSINIYYNSSPVEKPPSATTAQLSEVVRGEHRITAEVLDASGKILKRAAPVTFFYRQTAGGR